jgi:hypothetical protein
VSWDDARQRFRDRTAGTKRPPIAPRLGSACRPPTTGTRPPTLG